MDRLKTALAKRGARGVCGLIRMFKRLDTSGDRNLSMQEFLEGMRLIPVLNDLKTHELRQLFQRFDTDCSGFVSTDEFVTGVRGHLNARRLEMVDAAWEKMDALLPDSFFKIVLRAFSWYLLRRHY